jgi:hypothetical protein
MKHSIALMLGAVAVAVALSEPAVPGHPTDGGHNES